MEHYDTMEQPMIEQAMISVETCLSSSKKQVVVHFEAGNVTYTINWVYRG